VKLISPTSPVDAFNQALKVQTVESLQISRGFLQFSAHTASLQPATIQVACSQPQSRSDAWLELRENTPLSEFKTPCALKPTFLRSW
jgi:hypothetical protein|tara:strand:- start:170192 stop:170452 length:261 start_codon:yes stop_codon:yes gene_type:complete